MYMGWHDCDLATQQTNNGGGSGLEGPVEDFIEYMGWLSKQKDSLYSSFG
jgi:hypothetical protein